MQSIHGNMAVNVHLKNVWKSSDDASRCDNLRQQQPVQQQVITGIEPVPVPVITQPVSRRTALASLARRTRQDIITQRQIRQAYTISQGHRIPSSCGCRDFLRLQDKWAAYRSAVVAVASAQFWNFFLPLHTLSGVAIDAALGNAKKVFMTRNSIAWRTFPPTRRALFAKTNQVPAFWPEVTHTHTIDLEQFDLPSGTKFLHFKFIDPLWGWLMAARRQHPLDMHWKVAMSGSNPCYGGGVQYGQCFAEACSSCPPGTYVMAISLHWDGTSAHSGIACTPICIGVSNCNNCDSSTQFCLGYMPRVPDDSPEFRSTTRATSIKFFIRQQCIGAILRVLEAVAEKGIVCRLRNQLGLEVPRVLLPRLFAMNLDQPEAQLFMGLANRCSCSKCIWRKGRSAFRCSSRPQSRGAVKRLYAMTRLPATQRAASEKLRRWGFHPARQCCLLTECDKLLVKLPALDEVFPCVDFRDRMHGLIIFLHRNVTSTLDNLSKAVLGGPARRKLDRRLAYVCKGAFFRDPVTRRSFRRQKSIFSEVGMTAADKKCALFLLPHVLGPRADLFPENVATPLLTCISRIQLLLIAVSGRRMYTKQELEDIFDRGYKIVFGALQVIMQIDYEARVTKHRQNPDTTTAPRPHKRTRRTWANHRTPDTDTESTDEETVLAGVPTYSHGSYGLTHQHWVDQVISGGAFGVHCTQAAEAFHKQCMKLPAERVRHLGSSNQTSASMQEYLKYNCLFNEMNSHLHTSPARPRVLSNRGLCKTLSCEMGNNLANPMVQQSFLHPELRIARVELLDMLCIRLDLPRTPASYTLLESFKFHFGQQLVRSDGNVYWATDSSYLHSSARGGFARREVLCVAGYETVHQRRPDGSEGIIKNALCCQAVCFIVLDYVTTFYQNGGTLPREFQDRVRDDKLTMVIGRWFEPHPHALERDEQCRPVCPGELHINHCLWRFSATRNHRRALFRRDGTKTLATTRQASIFGKTLEEQDLCLATEKYAYFCLIFPDTITGTAFMSPMFVPGTATPDNSGPWLQTVTVA